MIGEIIRRALLQILYGKEGDTMRRKVLRIRRQAKAEWKN